MIIRLGQNFAFLKLGRKHLFFYLFTNVFINNEQYAHKLTAYDFTYQFIYIK